MSSTSQQPSSSRRLRQYELAERLGQIGHWYWRAGAETMVWSPELYRIYDVDHETFEVTIDNVLAAIAEPDRDRVTQALKAAHQSKESFAYEARLSCGLGPQKTIRSMGECELGPAGDLIGMFGVSQDISEWRTAQDELQITRERQTDFAEMSSDWLWEMGPDLRFTYISPQLLAMTRTEQADWLGRTRREIISEEEVTLDVEMHLAWLEQRKPYRDFRFWLRTPDGQKQYVTTTGKPVFDINGAFQGYRGSGRDITKEEEARIELLKANRMMKAASKEKSDALASLKEANALLEERAEEMLRVQENIRHTALHDPLTGIANRRYLDQRLAEWAARCKREDGWLAALHIDLDRFKQINDTVGHAAGDALLVHVAETLKDTVRGEDFVGRIGGDEFVVLCTGQGDQLVLSRIAERIIERMSKPFMYDRRECWFGASIGIASMQGADIKADELLVNADIALYRAKNRGRGCYEYFSEELQAEIIRSKEIADGIRVGLQQGEFIPYFQPQIDANTFQITGFEALARWNHPINGLLAPDAFLAIAEELNAVATIDSQILEQAITCHQTWTTAGLIIPKVSVNVSAKRLLDRNLITKLKELNLPPNVIAFELLESVFLDDAEEQIIWNIDMLKEMGIDVELDDFGSGHASIVSLIKLDPDAIKIDRELISAITDDDARRNLVRSIIEIGKSLDVRVIAEGVETLSHANLLRDLGCDTLQGFVVSHPLPPDRVPGFVQAWNGSHARPAKGS